LFLLFVANAFCGNFWRLEAMANVRGWELIIILVVVVLIFGVGRIGKIAGELGSGIRAFGEGLKGDDEEESTAAQDEEKSEG
jgi:sec-independent protein translocase protein TatA